MKNTDISPATVAGMGNFDMYFSDIETQHVRYSHSGPRAGEMLVISLPDLSAEFCYPCQGHLLSPYGMRSGRMHTGVDIKANQGDTIRAALAGVVRMSKPYSDYGNLVVVRHPCGMETVYAHNVRNLVKVNDRVMPGQPIALAGHSGNASGDHLHFEVRVAGEHFNPGLLLDCQGRTIKGDTLYIYNRGSGLVVHNGSSAGNLFKSDNTAAAKSQKNQEPARAYAAAGNIGIASTPAAGEAAPAADAGVKATNYHTVARGETLSIIARSYGVGVDEICSLNKIKDPRKLSVGQRIAIPGSGRPAVSAGQREESAREKPRDQAAEPSTATAAAETAARQSKKVVHTVGRGESLSSISQKYGVSVEDICTVNGIDNPDRLSAGQRLDIPSGKQASAGSSAKPQSPAYSSYTIRKGDTLGKIARSKNTSIAALCQANGLTEKSILREGQKLKIPQ